jgi:hypothetical protein
MLGLRPALQEHSTTYLPGARYPNAPSLKQCLLLQAALTALDKPHMPEACARATCTTHHA